MQLKKISYAISLSLLSTLINSTEACTAVVVGKAASANQSSFIARNEDFGDNNWGKHLVYHPAKVTKGGKWDLGDGLIVPMPKQLYAYSALPDWDAKTSNSEGKYFEERGVNEFNVAISATNSADINQKVSDIDPLIKTGVTEALIPSLILPQVKTAKQGVELLGKYIKEYGAGEGNILYIADEQGIWLMEIGSGHHWIAVKVPEDSYAVVSNALSVHGVDLNADDVLHSEGLYDFVEKHQLLENPNQQSFNFAKAFGVLGDIYNTHRVWLGQKILTPSVKQSENEAIYPLFQKPDHPITINDITSVLGADFKGTALEKTGKRPMRVEKQLETHVIEIRPQVKKPLQVITWQSFGVLTESLLVPIYSTTTQYPKSFSTGGDLYDSNSAYWQFRSLTTLANIDANKYYPFIHKQLEIKQQDIMSRFAEMDKQLIAQDNQEMVAKDAADFSTRELSQAVESAKMIQSKILTDLTKLSEGEKYTDKEKDHIMAIPKEK